jgi:MFS family permease
MYLAFGILCGTAIVSSGYIPVMTLANNWFIKRRTLAIGICLAGVGVGTLVLAPVNRLLIDLLSWRQAWLAIAALDFAIGLLPAIFITRARPEDIGQLPDGEELTEEELEEVLESTDYKVPYDWKTREALKTPIVWLVAGMMATNLFAGSLLTTHQVAYLQDMGISPLAAASAIGLMIGISTLGRLAGGALGDRFQPRYLAAIGCAIQAAALIILINAKNLGLVYLYVIIFGIPYGMIIVLFPAMIGAYFGRKNYSTIFGFSNTMVQLIGATGPALAGFIFDATGSYFIPLTIATVFCLVGGSCAILAQPPKPPRYSSQ